MTYTIAEHKKVQVLQVINLLNEYDNKAILEEVDNCIHAGKKDFIIDLAALDFMNSVGINFLISMMKKAQHAKGTLAVTNASSQVLNLLEITKLKTMFNLQPSLEQALDIVNQQR